MQHPHLLKTRWDSEDKQAPAPFINFPPHQQLGIYPYCMLQPLRNTTPPQPAPQEHHYIHSLHHYLVPVSISTGAWRAKSVIERQDHGILSPSRRTAIPFPLAIWPLGLQASNSLWLTHYCYLRAVVVLATAWGSHWTASYFTTDLIRPLQCRGGRYRIYCFCIIYNNKYFSLTVARILLFWKSLLRWNLTI